MAGKTVILDPRMAGYQRTGCNHLVRKDEQQNKQRRQRKPDAREEAGTFQCQPQKRKIARIWASARPQNARVIGTWITRHCLMMFTVKL